MLSMIVLCSIATRPDWPQPGLTSGYHTARALSHVHSLLSLEKSSNVPQDTMTDQCVNNCDTLKPCELLKFVSVCCCYHHHLFAQYAEMNSKICNVPDRKANSFSSNNCP